MIETPFGDLLRSYREQKDLTLKFLAEKAELSPSYISLLISGKKGRPSDGVIKKIAKALNLTEEEETQLFRAAEQTVLPLRDRLSATPFPIMAPLGAGIFGVHKELPEQLFKNQANQADDVIRIQEIFCESVISYASTLRAVLSTKRTNLKIQILLLDPSADDITEARRKALGNASKNYIQNRILSAIDEFDAIRNGLGHNCEQFEVRTFKTVPSIQQIVCDEVSYIGFFLYGQLSQSNYQLEIRSPSPLGELFRKEFENVWQADGTEVAVPKQTKAATETGH